MNNETKKTNSSLPIAIIGLVLLAAVAGGYWFYQNSKATTATKAKSTPNVNKKDDKTALEIYAKAAPGAQPVNFLGAPNAAVTVEEFADYQCPTCAATHPKMKELNAIYGSRIKFVFRNFPLPMHKHGYAASVAAEAAGLQGKFWEMQNQLFTNQQSWANAADARKIFGEYAQKIGLDVNKFETDSLGLAAKQRVDADLQRARSLNVGGTPTIYVNGREVPAQQFEISVLRQIIDAELQKAPGANAQTVAAPTGQTTANDSENTNEARKDAGNSSEKK